MNDSGVILNEDTHEYTRGGAYVPGVSHLLKQAGVIHDGFFTQESADRGTAVHKAAQYIAQDDLDRDSIDPRIAGYVAAIDRFMRETGYVSERSEFIVEHKRFNYCGRCDDTGIMRINGAARVVYIDWKTGAKLPWHRLQTAAYVGADKQSDGLIFNPRVCVYLKSNGKYTMDIHLGKTDFTEFLHKTNLL